MHIDFRSQERDKNHLSLSSLSPSSRGNIMPLAPGECYLMANRARRLFWLWRLPTPGLYSVFCSAGPNGSKRLFEWWRWPTSDLFFSSCHHILQVLRSTLQRDTKYWKKIKMVPTVQLTLSSRQAQLSLFTISVCFSFLSFCFSDVPLPLKWE